MGVTEELSPVISFCSGYGGIERGLDLAGFEHRVVCYVEIEAYAIANLVNKMESGELAPAPIYTDLKTFPAHLFRNKISLVTGGYPCQPFSAAGKRLGDKDPRHLWPFIRRHVETIRPVSCFFENVEGHVSLGLREVLSDLEGLGYRQTWGIFSAREVGAPHQRKRVYILGDATNARLSERITGAIHEPGEVQQPQRSGLDELANTSSGRLSEQGKREVQQQRRTEVIRPGENGPENLADANDTRQQPVSGTIQQPEVGNDARRRGEIMADTISTRSATGISGPERPDEKGNSREPYHGDSERLRRAREMFWPPEPGMGRVVDGCSDRVDRIRLLGNGVVPQTAAIAWEVLSKELHP